MDRRESSSQQPRTCAGSARADPEVDAWLRVVTGGVDLTGVELRYTLPMAVEPWIAEFARIVSEELGNAGRVRRNG